MVAFRRELSPDERKVVRFRRLEPEATYVLENADNGDRVEATGRQLMDGFTMSIGQPRSSLLIKYGKK